MNLCRNPNTVLWTINEKIGLSFTNNVFEVYELNANR